MRSISASIAQLQFSPSAQRNVFLACVRKPRFEALHCGVLVSSRPRTYGQLESRLRSAHAAHQDICYEVAAEQGRFTQAGRQALQGKL